MVPPVLHFPVLHFESVGKARRKERYKAVQFTRYLKRPPRWRVGSSISRTRQWGIQRNYDNHQKSPLQEYSLDPRYHSQHAVDSHGNVRYRGTYSNTKSGRFVETFPRFDIRLEYFHLPQLVDRKIRRAGLGLTRESASLSWLILDKERTFYPHPRLTWMTI